MTSQKHPFHLVDPSPWPLVGSTAVFRLTTGTVMILHGFNGGGSMARIGLFRLLATFALWWRDVVREGTFEGQHTHVVQLGLRSGMLLFIVSEVMFFFAFFWAFFWAALAPTPELGSVWPPQGIPVLSAWEIPRRNTIILLASGAAVTWAHHVVTRDNSSCGPRGNKLDWGRSLWAAVALSVCIAYACVFTWLQAIEYQMAGFTISDSVYGSAFFMATGFHGFHVAVGTMFLAVCLYRMLRSHFTREHHFGLEAAAWYWHFVDVVWLFLFIAVYAWGGL